jgi:hypothetical protein
LNEIIEVLESPPPADQTSLRELYNALVATQKVTSNKAAFRILPPNKFSMNADSLQTMKCPLNRI